MNKSLTLVLAGVTVTVAACASSPGTRFPSSGTGDQSAGTRYSLAFARCMRAHGVPKFPDPGGDLGPDSGAGLGSPVFQAAVNGQCRSLAPAAWVSVGVSSEGS
jgi:hypothetical protein